MGFSDAHSQFNKASFLPQGWFWLLQSSELKKGAARGVRFYGQELVVFRGEDGECRAMEAYCPHMGAHLGDGIVQGNSLRCLFHNWKFAGDGRCIEIPSQSRCSGVPPLKAYKVGERYGLIWIWTGANSTIEPIPEVPELEGMETASALGKPFAKNCHPNVVMINAIDANHFNTVHKLIVPLEMERDVKGEHCIRFHNTTRVPRNSRLTRFIARFYQGALTYDMTYWYGHTGTVTLGPDFLHFYIMFALRPLPDGTTEGQTVLITKKRAAWINRLLLFATKVVGNYFAKGDTIIFSKIKFNLSTPVPADAAIVDFIRHYERQPGATAFDKLQSFTPRPAELRTELSGQA